MTIILFDVDSASPKVHNLAIGQYNTCTHCATCKQKENKKWNSEPKLNKQFSDFYKNNLLKSGLMDLYKNNQFNSRQYSGFPGCQRDSGTAVSGILATITSVILVIQMVFNIANSNNNENKKNENNNNNNNNNNVQEYNNVFVSDNENMMMAMGGMMIGRKRSSSTSTVECLSSWIVCHADRYLHGPESESLVQIYLKELYRQLVMELGLKSKRQSHQPTPWYLTRQNTSQEVKTCDQLVKSCLNS